MKLKIKKGDNVKVIAGSNKGKTGTVSLIIVENGKKVRYSKKSNEIIK